MASVFRSVRALPLTRLAAAARPAQTPAAGVRAFSTSFARLAGQGPPQLLGEGAKAGTIPTDVEQATGLERFELLGKLEGVDVFDMNPVEMTRLGTKADPIAIYSLFPERQVGCTGYPADSHDTIWLNVTQEKEHHRCPECGCVYKLNFQGNPHADAHHH